MLKKLRQNKWFKIFGNIYILVLTFFVVWMFFFDANNWWFTHSELNDEIDKLEKQQEHLRGEIEHDKALIRQLQDKDSLEKYARERYYFKKEDEEIYLIEFDTLKNE
ncbi:Cell division protein FtsB [Pustulibacterium marinum]|uniref:Cell division protein FtsB n=1 Tax=Pustulibacterium marinum TaxID=1224947 RepID=A0A1I7H6W0_9FLAO|nr:septum formation initiator family protein [Pustulibacterium marinum]SFU56236.1 Cell division protein FtsB [Pustulibacterium marinum]